MAEIIDHSTLIDIGAIVIIDILELGVGNFESIIVQTLKEYLVYNCIVYNLSIFHHLLIFKRAKNLSTKRMVCKENEEGFLFSDVLSQNVNKTTIVKRMRWSYL